MLIVILAVFQDGHFFGIHSFFALTLATLINAHIDNIFSKQ